MRLRRGILALVLAPALIAAAFATTAGAAELPPAADEAHAERSLLRHLHFDYGLVVACGLADDEVETGYQIRASKIEQRLGIEDDAEARYSELNLGWTEADADWAAKGGPAFLERCRNEAAAARDRFKQAFKDTGEKLSPRPKEKKK
ncbi:MAG: hypothetical protein HYW28_07520 [Rhodospirillales bacterium]|nr:hypothetical protein [Rhodospirillales bacterium]MBI2585708.1 hypothetical protein [Rhodospirillales bacterium]